MSSRQNRLIPVATLIYIICIYIIIHIYIYVYQEVVAFRYFVPLSLLALHTVFRAHLWQKRFCNATVVFNHFDPTDRPTISGAFWPLLLQAFGASRFLKNGWAALPAPTVMKIPWYQNPAQSLFSPMTPQTHWTTLCKFLPRTLGQLFLANDWSEPPCPNCVLGPKNPGLKSTVSLGPWERCLFQASI